MAPRVEIEFVSDRLASARLAQAFGIAEEKARVIVPNGEEPTVATIAELLPNKYVRGTGRW